MDSPAFVEITVGGLPYRIHSGKPLTIGRAEDNDIQIDHESISNHHATVSFENGLCLLTDHHSTNGSFVNGQRVIAAPLNAGDHLCIGAVTLELRSSTSPLTKPAPAATPQEDVSAPDPAPSSKPAFLWWPEGRIARRCLIVVLSLIFALFSLGAPPIGGVIAAGGFYLWIAFLRWLFINSRQAFGSSSSLKPIPSERIEAAVRSVSTHLQPALKNVQRTAADLATDAANRAKPLLDQTKAKWFELPKPKRRTLAFGGGAVLLLLLILVMRSGDEADSPRYNYTPPTPASTSDNISMSDLTTLALIDQAMQEQRNEMNRSPVYGVPGSQSSGLSSDWHETMCIPCVGRGTITTPSGYVTTCTSCGGRGKVRVAGPQVQALQKY